MFKRSGPWTNKTYNLPPNAYLLPHWYRMIHIPCHAAFCKTPDIPHMEHPTETQNHARTWYPRDVIFDATIATPLGCPWHVRYRWKRDRKNRPQKAVPLSGSQPRKFKKEHRTCFFRRENDFWAKFCRFWAKCSKKWPKIAVGAPKSVSQNPFQILKSGSQNLMSKSEIGLSKPLPL